MILNNREQYTKIQKNTIDKTSDIWKAFCNDMLIRISWNTNSLEGNTLSLEETLDVVQYDTVRAGHSYSEYRDAVNVYRTLCEYLDFMGNRSYSLDDIVQANKIINNGIGGFRQKNVFIGTLSEMIYKSVPYQEVEKKIENWFSETNKPTEIRDIAKRHILFERIHPFIDGNGRTGRLILHQDLLNLGYLPCIIKDRSLYRRAFREYDKNGELSVMEHIILGGIIEAQRILEDFRNF